MNKPKRIHVNKTVSTEHQGQHLRAFIDARSMSVNTLATALGKQAHTVSAYFKTPTLRNNTRTAIAQFLGATQAEIFGMPPILIDPLPTTAELSPMPDVHQGRRLRTYLRTYGISYQQLGEWLGRHASSVNNYVKREWLLPKIRREIVHQLQAHGFPTASALSVFEEWGSSIDADLLGRLTQAYQRQRQYNAGNETERLMREMQIRLAQLMGQSLTKRYLPTDPALSQAFIGLAARAMLLSEAVAPQQPRESPSLVDATEEGNQINSHNDE